MNRIRSQLKVIIRSVGERTEDVCRSLIAMQGIEHEDIAVVREAPFSAAMRRSFEIGLDCGRPWTFCVDADVMLRQGAIENMLEFADRQASEVCEIHGFVLCKFFGGPRTAGNHLYRTRLLERVIENIPAEGVDIRPENHALERMRARGNPWVRTPQLVGLHDFEQYYGDVFRKCFVQAHKHAYLTPMFLSLWRDRISDDDDFRVALAGFAHGIEHEGAVYIDVKRQNFADGFTRLKMLEKQPLVLSDWSFQRVEDSIRNWRVPEAFFQCNPDGMTRAVLASFQPSLIPDVPLREKFRQKYQEVGAARFIPYLLGAALARVGGAILRWSKRGSRRGLEQ